MATLLELKRAGFTNEEISLWYNEKKLELDSAGFNRVEQSSYFGIPFQSKVQITDSLIGPENSEQFINPNDKNLKPDEIRNNEHDRTLETDNLSEKINQKKLQDYEKLIDNKIMQSIQNKDEVPFNFDGLEKIAFINRNKNNLDQDAKIYDVDGKPIDKDYYTEFTLNEDIINKYSGHTLNTLQHIYNNTGVSKGDYGVSSYILNTALKHYAKVLSGNESWGSRSYSWGDGTYGMYRMTAEQIQTALNVYLNILTSDHWTKEQPIPYWVSELKEDKDISGLTQDAQTALFLTYLSTQSGFAKNFKGLMRNDQGSIIKLLQEQFLIPRKINVKEMKLLTNRLTSNIDQKWLSSIEQDTKEVGSTSMQLPAFGKGMPDFISMFGDHLMGEGRKDAWERGGMQSVTEMMWRMFWELKEAEKTGKKLDAVKLIEEFMTEGQRWDKRGMAGIRSIAQDLVWFGAGSVMGMGESALLAIGTGGMSAPLSPFIITGNAFALHGVLRHALIESYMQNETDTFEGFWNIVFSKTSLKVYGKDFALGAGVHAGGLIAGKIIGPLLTKTGMKWKVWDDVKKKMVTKFSDWGLKVNNTSKVTGEIIMLATLPSILNSMIDKTEYLPPTKADFLDAAVIIFGLKAGIHGVSRTSPYVKDGVKKLYRIYLQTGKSPKEILKDINRDPSILDDLQNNDVDMPKTYEVMQKNITEKMNESTGKNVENIIKHQSKPKYQVGNEVFVDATSKEKGKIIDVGYENGKNFYIIEYGKNKKVRLSEELVEKYIPKSDKETVWKDDTQFKNKKENGEYDSKIEILQRDEQVYEKHRYNETEALDFGSLKWLADTKQLVLSNNNMLFLTKYYLKLKAEVKDFSSKKISLQELVSKFIPKETNEKPVKFLFTVDKDNRLDVESKVVVGEVEGKFFHWDLQPYMALKKFADGTMASVSAHLEITYSKYNVTGKRDSASAILVFRDKGGNLTGLLHSRKPNHKVSKEAFKFRSEFGTKNKEFADAAYTSRAREVPKWEDVVLEKGTNIFKGLEFYDLVKMIRELSEGDNPVAKNFRRLKKFGYGKPFGKMVYTEGGKGEIQLSKDLLAMDKEATKTKTYDEKLQLILMTLAHEIGHYIDFLPNKTLARGNILGRIANLKKYLNHWIREKPDGKGEGPFTDVELRKFHAEAEKTARAESKSNDKFLKKHKFQPKDVLKILTDAKSREYLPPAIYEAFAKASAALKKSIIADALKGIHNPKIISILLGQNKIGKASKERINAIYNEIIRKEVVRRGLVGRSEVMMELKRLTLFMKKIEFLDDKGETILVKHDINVPKVKNKNLKEYLEYRFSPEELMADFMMAFLLHPKQAQNLAPISWKFWFHYMNKKQEVADVWNAIQTELNLPSDKRSAIAIKDVATSYKKTRQNMLEKAEKEADITEAYDLTRRGLDSVWFTLLNYYKKVMGDKSWWFAAKENKRFKVKDRDNVELAIENLLYGDTLIEAIQNKLWQMVFVPMRDAGVNRDIFATYLHFKWVAKEDGPRANVLNPKGIEYKKANELVRQMEKDNPVLKDLAERFYKFREEVILPELEKSEVFDAATLALIRNNREYVTFVVEEYANWRNDSWVKTFAYQTKYGTAKDIMNPFEAIILKDWQMVTIAQRHYAVGVIARFLNKYKVDIEGLNRKELNWKKGFKLNGKYKILRNVDERTIEPAIKNVKKNKEGVVIITGWKPVDKNLDFNKYELIEWTENGQMKAAYFGNEVAYGLSAMQRPKDVMSFTNFMYGINTPYRKMFTELNPTFWSYNIFRDINRTILNLPHTTYLDLRHGFKNSFLKQVYKAWRPTYRNMMKRNEIQDKDITEMLDRRLFISIYSKYRSRAEGMSEGVPSWAATDGAIRGIILLLRNPNWRKLADKELEAIVEKGYKEKAINKLTQAERDLAPSLRDSVISKFESQMYIESWFNNESRVPIYYKLVTQAEKISRVFERTTKLAAFRHLNKLRAEGLIDWTDAQIDYAIRNWAGSPNFLRKGGAAALYNNVFLFGNAAKEEWRSVLEAKRYQKEHIWWPKLFAYALAPQAIYFAGKLGMMGTAAHLYFNLIGNDTLANYYVVPLGVINDAGELEFGLTSETGSTYKAVYLQFPKDEMVKMFGSAVYHGYNDLFNEISDNPLDNTWEKLIKGVVPSIDNNLPSFSPVIATLMNAFKITGYGKEPPKDAFTGMPIWPDHVHNAQGLFGFGTRALAYSKWLWNNSGGLMFYKFDTFYDPYNFENIVSEIEKKLGIPIIGTTVGRFIKVSNQGIPEKVWKDIEEGRIINDHYMSVADHAVHKLLNDKKLSDKEWDALSENKGWLVRYTDALQRSYGTVFFNWLIGLKGEDFDNAIKSMSKVLEETGYEPPLLEVGKKNK
jgi:hypothetical protein|tara:strand:- start:13 stop:7134 length:7122 start_codon:yes stop_codon:yes gene_type:complete